MSSSRVITIAAYLYLWWAGAAYASKSPHMDIHDVDQKKTAAAGDEYSQHRRRDHYRRPPSAVAAGAALLDDLDASAMLLDEARHYVVPRVWQRLASASGHAVTSPPRTEMAAGDAGRCTHFQQTSGCTPGGPPERVRPCADAIPAGTSGYCVCTAAAAVRSAADAEWRGPGFGCDHDAVTCHALCGVRVNRTLPEPGVLAAFREMLYGCSTAPADAPLPVLPHDGGDPDDEGDAEAAAAEVVPAETLRGGAVDGRRPPCRRREDGSLRARWRPPLSHVDVDAAARRWVGESDKVVTDRRVAERDEQEDADDAADDADLRRATPRRRLPLPHLSAGAEDSLKQLQRARMRAARGEAEAAPLAATTDRPEQDDSAGRAAFLRVMSGRRRQQLRAHVARRLRMLQQFREVYGDRGAASGLAVGAGGAAPGVGWSLDETIDLQRVFECEYGVPLRGAGSSGAQQGSGERPAVLEAAGRLRGILTAAARAAQDAAGAVHDGVRVLGAAPTAAISSAEAAVLRSHVLSRLLADVLPPHNRPVADVENRSAGLFAAADAVDALVVARIDRVLGLLRGRLRFLEGFTRRERIDGGTKERAVSERDALRGIEAHLAPGQAAVLASAPGRAGALDAVLAAFTSHLRGWAHTLDAGLLPVAGLDNVSSVLSPVLTGDAAFALDTHIDSML